jgi:predicted nucleic acid-binding protein
VYYLETSALLKKYRTEKGTEVVEELFTKKGETEAFITSYFTVLEVVSVATRLLRAGILTRGLYRAILGNLERDTREVILLQSTSDAVISEATKQSMNYALRAPDAIHLATALRAKNATNEPLYFLCTDVKLKRACEGCRLAVLDPEGTDSMDALKSYRSID